jgi:hypothetical protein
VLEQYANNSIESDHGRLKARLRPMRGLKRIPLGAHDRIWPRIRAEPMARTLRTRHRPRAQRPPASRIHRTCPLLLRMPHAVKDDLACRRSINAAVPGDLVALAVQLAFEVCAGVTPPGGEVVFDAIFAKADKANEVFPIFRGGLPGPGGAQPLGDVHLGVGAAAAAGSEPQNSESPRSERRIRCCARVVKRNRCPNARCRRGA